MAPQTPIEFGPIQPGEETPVINMVLRSFEAGVAPEYTERGVAEFQKYASLKEMALRARSSHFILVARQNQNPVGMIEIRSRRHISMFFVETDFQNLGIGRQLLVQAVSKCRKKQPDLKEITVNASPNAVPAYRRLGFIQSEAEKTANGIRYLPMKLELNDK